MRAQYQMKESFPPPPKEGGNGCRTDDPMALRLIENDGSGVKQGHNNKNISKEGHNNNEADMNKRIISKTKKLNINNSNLDISKKTFEGCIEELKQQTKDGKYLEYNQENLETLLASIRLSPLSEQYPHPLIWEVFEVTRRMMWVEGNCVASWSDPNAMGIKVGRGGMKAGIIIGVYGGIDSIKKSMYNLEVSVTGHRKRVIDGDPVYGGIALYGRINEDIHYGKVNTEFDVGGIVYTTLDTTEDEELLTTYGSDYVWDHVFKWDLTELMSI